MQIRTSKLGPVGSLRAGFQSICLFIAYFPSKPRAVAEMIVGMAKTSDAFDVFAINSRRLIWVGFDMVIGRAGVRFNRMGEWTVTRDTLTYPMYPP